MTIPFDHVPLPEQREWVEELVDLGYTDVWSSEANGADAFTPLALASVWAPSLRLGTAIVPAYTRGPATLAQQVAREALRTPHIDCRAYDRSDRATTLALADPALQATVPDLEFAHSVLMLGVEPIDDAPMTFRSLS